MGSKKVHVFLVKPTGKNMSNARLIRGTLAQVEAKLRGEVEIEPAKPEETHAMPDMEIEYATDEQKPF